MERLHYNRCSPRPLLLNIRTGVFVLNPLRTADEPSTHRSLLQRAQAGSDDGWRTLVQIYGPVVYGWIRRCGVQSADAADVMQETLMAVSQAIGRFDGDRTGATFRGWLWTIAKNKMRDRQRLDARGDAVAIGGVDWDIVEGADPPSEIVDDKRGIELRMLEILRTKIEPKTWAMFYRVVVEGHDTIAVAEDMHVSRWTVYKARARVLKRLRQEMQGVEE